MSIVESELTENQAYRNSLRSQLSMMREPKKKPREIHYELVPQRNRGTRKVSTCKILFASVIGIIIIALIAFFLLLLFTIYLRPNAPPSYIPGKDVPDGKVPTRRPLVRAKKSLQIFVVYHHDNLERATDVESYLNASLLRGGERSLELSVQKLSSSNLTQSTLEVEIHNRTLLKTGSVIVFVSELMTPSAARIEEMIKTDHRTCSKLDIARCVEICSVTTEPYLPVPSWAPPPISFDAISIEVSNLIEVSQDSAIYRQLSRNQFSLTRRRRGCAVYS